MRYYIVFFSCLFVLSTCKKNELEQPYDNIIGEFDWFFSSYRESPLGSLKYKYPQQENFSASLKFTQKNEVFFIVDEQVLASSKFTVIEQSATQDNFEMIIRVKIKENLTIDRDIQLTMFGNDSLHIAAFPYNSYKSITSHNRSNLFVKR